MNVKHNQRVIAGLQFCDLISGQAYIRIDIRSSRVPVYLATGESPGPGKTTNLVNLETGCLVGRVSSGARFRHLPDATLDTGE